MYIYCYLLMECKCIMHHLIKYITFGLLPINGIKALVVSVLTYILYKRVSVSIFKAEPNFGSPENKTI